MCDFEAKLVAWLDHELAAADAVAVEQHVSSCSDCRSRANGYKDVSAAFTMRCEAVAAAQLAKGSRGEPVLQGQWMFATVASAVVLMIALWVYHVNRSHPRALAADPDIVVLESHKIPRTEERESISAVFPPRHVSTKLRRRNDFVNVRQQANAAAPPAAMRLAIPADAVLPPGAAPEGVDFVLDVSVSPDGGTESFAVKPQFIGFERRGRQP